MIKQEIELLILKEAMKKHDNEIELIKFRLEKLEPKPRVETSVSLLNRFAFCC
jgi:hypothetical protein